MRDARGARFLSLSHSRAPAPHHPADVPPLETLDDLDAARDLLNKDHWSGLMCAVRECLMAVVQELVREWL